MTGAPAQLALQGSQDKYLHYKAYHSFFAASHLAYENFAVESIEIGPQGAADLGRRSTFNIDGQAEKIGGAALQITLPALTGAGGQDIAWIHSIGFYIFDKMEFKAQGQILDTQYPEYMDMWSRLTVSASQREGFNDMIGEINFVNRFVNGNTIVPNQFDPNANQVLALTKPQVNILVPLNFWWCQDWTQSIPIGVLLYTKLAIEVYFRAADQCYIQSGAVALGTQPSLVDVKLYVDYVFMDDASRNRLARDAHFYVYKQTQFQGVITVNAATFSYKLPFVMPVCHLMFGIREQAAIAVNVRRFDWWDRFAGNSGAVGETSNIPQQPFTQAELRINSQIRFSARDYLYWSRYQPYKHHTSIPSTRGIWLFSFALFPEQSDASGAANLSRSENNYLNLTMNNAGGFGVGGQNGGPGDLYVFVTNYNYIYIEAGFLTVLYNA